MYHVQHRLYFVSMDNATMSAKGSTERDHTQFKNKCTFLKLILWFIFDMKGKNKQLETAVRVQIYKYFTDKCSVVLSFRHLQYLNHKVHMSRCKHECSTTLVSCLWLLMFTGPSSWINQLCGCFQNIPHRWPCPNPQLKRSWDTNVINTNFIHISIYHTHINMASMKTYIVKYSAKIENTIIFVHGTVGECSQ